MAKKKVAKKISRKVARVSVKTKRSVAMAKFEPRVDRVILQNRLGPALAKYRMAIAKLNSKRHELKLLRAKVLALECRIAELERALAEKSQ